MRKIYSLVTIIVILLSFSITYTIQTNIQTNKLGKTEITYTTNKINSYKQSNNITIVDNQDFSNQAQLNGWSGSGTQNNPFIIQNLMFNFTNKKSNSIILLNFMLLIKNVSVYFSVRNNFFIGQNSSFFGIYLYNCKNALFQDNSFYKTTEGIEIINSTNINVQNNVFNYSASSLNVRQSNEIETKGNTFIGNNSYLISLFNYVTTNNSEIINNTFKGYQLSLVYDLNLSFTDNYLIPSSLSIYFCKALINYNIFKNIYFAFAINIQFYMGVFSFIPSYLIQTYGSVIEHNLFQNNSVGIQTVETQNPYHFFPNGTITNAFYSCPGFLECSELPANYSGPITFHYSNYIIRYNEFVNNTSNAIYINSHSDNNTIYGNDFINNHQSRFNAPNTLNNPSQSTTQVYESPIQNVSNYWSYNGVGNYWSDYNYQNNGNSSTGQVPMIIPANDSDPYPLVNSQNNTYIYPYGPKEPFNIFKSLNEFLNNEAIPIIVTGSVIAALLIMSAVLVENRKYKKSMAGNNIPHRSFKNYLQTKYHIKKPKEHQIVTDETFEKIEEIIKENKDD